MQVIFHQYSGAVSLFNYKIYMGLIICSNVILENNVLCAYRVQPTLFLPLAVTCACAVTVLVIFKNLQKNAQYAGHSFVP